MQSNHHDIYKMVAEKTGKSEQMYKDLGSFIFKETAQQLKNPTSLILKLKGLGSWRLRKKRMQVIVEDFPDRGILPNREDCSGDEVYLDKMEKYIQYEVFKKRLEEYDRYLGLKSEIRKERFKTQVLLSPIDTDDKYKSE